MSLDYRQTFSPSYFECDPQDRLTPGAALRRIQEIATDQCESLGIDPAFYARTGTAFVLSRMSLRIARMPAAKQPVQMDTRAYGMRRAVYYRVTTLTDEAGEVLCEADTRWVLIDVNSRRILRQPLPEFIGLFNAEPDYDEHPMKLPKAEELGAGRPLTARWSICDRNGHLNNSRYADILCDTLPPGQLAAGPPKRMLFSYHNEIPLGADFQLAQGPAENGVYFLATTGESKNFEGFVTFE